MSVLDTLADPEVRGYFLGVIRSDALTAEQKYQRFIDYFKLERKLGERLDQHYGAELNGARGDERVSIVSKAARDLDIWNPERIPRDTESSIRRGLRWIEAHQFPDGGWGYLWGGSNTWGTAHALLALLSARDVLGGSFDARTQVEHGVAWIEANHSQWSIADVPASGERSVYDTAIAVRCLRRAGRTKHPVAARCLEALVACQNDDGGWEKSVWAPDFRNPEKVGGEVGATGHALLALGESGAPTPLHAAIAKGVRWLCRTQNEDGSFIDKFSPGADDDARKSINKTCDALQGIMAGQGVVPQEEVAPNIRRAVEWVLAQERILRSETRSTTGWGFDDPHGNGHKRDLISTCLTLETLVKMPDASLPPLTVNARWLLDAQQVAEGSPEDGNWASGDTFRITLGLIEYYRRIKQSPIFADRGDSPATSRAEGR